MEHGVALEPENASAWDRLGHARETDFVNPDPAGAVADFQKAVALVPLSATYWMDLAGGYESIGNFLLAREAFNHARAVYPESAQVAWSYGNFLLRPGRRRQRLCPNQSCRASRSDSRAARRFSSLA